MASVEELPELFNKQEISDQAKPVAAPADQEALEEADRAAGGCPNCRLSLRESTVFRGAIGDEAGLPEPAPLGRRGRKTVLNEKMQEQLCMLLSVGLSRRQAASYLDIDQSTISHAAGRDEDFAHSLKRAEDLAAVQPMMALIGASRKNWRAAAWLMAHKLKYPAALSDDEKSEQLAEKLADAHRNVAYARELTQIHEAAREAEQARLFAKDLARRQAELEERIPRRKKRVTGERQRKLAGGSACRGGHFRPFDVTGQQTQAARRSVTCGTIRNRAAFSYEGDSSCDSSIC